MIDKGAKKFHRQKQIPMFVELDLARFGHSSSLHVVDREKQLAAVVWFEENEQMEVKNRGRRNTPGHLKTLCFSGLWFMFEGMVLCFHAC